MVWRQTTAPRIDLGRLAGFEYPGFEILDDALVQLMKHVGGDGIEDVEVGKFEPEGLGNRLCTDPRSSLKEPSGILME